MSKAKSKTPEVVKVRPQEVAITELGLSSDKPFIISNTVQCPLSEIKNNHIIPVFVKDNEPAINHSDFIEVVQEVAQSFYRGEKFLQPSVRVSHPIKGRIPEARLKQAKDLRKARRLFTLNAWHSSWKYQA